jgi:hypothetical protein
LDNSYSDRDREQHIKTYFPNGSLKEDQYGYIPERFVKPDFSFNYIIRWHRLDGPAHIVYNKKGEVTQYKWWVYGNKLSQKIIDKYFLNPLKPTDEEVFIFKLAEL